MVKNRDPIGTFIERHVFETHFLVLWIPEHWKSDRFHDMPEKWAVYVKEADKIDSKHNRKSDAKQAAKKAAKSNKPAKVVIRKKSGHLDTEIEYHGKHVYGNSIRG